MAILSERAELIQAAVAAHLIGLVVVGFYGTIGTSGGFGNGAWAGMLAGGIISVPWFLALLAVIWCFTDFYSRNYVDLSILGAVLVCSSWWLMDGPDMLDAVALTAMTDSIAFLVLISLVRWKRTSKV